MTSRLGYAILALLARLPSTGYELSARARRPLGYFWTAQHGQIYPELSRLLDAGFVSFTTSPGPGPRHKKVYSVTAAGMRELAEWVVRPPAPARGDRDEMLLKAYACWTADQPAAAALFNDQISRHQDRLTRYLADWQAVQSRHGGGPPPVTHPDFGSHATLRFGIDYERQRIGWLRWMADALSAEKRLAGP